MHLIIQNFSFSGMAGNGPLMQKLYAPMACVAGSGANALLPGEKLPCYE
jgi:hypothetical protein